MKTIGSEWLRINERAIDSDAETDVDCAFRHLRARLAAAMAVKIGVPFPVRLMVVSAVHVSEPLQLRVAMHTCFILVIADQIADSLLEQVVNRCQEEGLRCFLRLLSDDGPRYFSESQMYELLVEPEQG